MDGIEEQEPIFELATECESIYITQLLALNKRNDRNAEKILLDLYQRFTTWASFWGVFSPSNMCLDRTLRHNVEIQDQILHLLDMMLSNLTNLFENSDHSEQGDFELPETLCVSPQHVLTRIQSLEAVSAALERLNRIGNTIRRLSITSQTPEAKKFPAIFDVASFEEVAYLSLKMLYAHATDSLVKQLARSMVGTYALFLRRNHSLQQLPISFRETSQNCMRLEAESIGETYIDMKTRQGGREFYSTFSQSTAPVKPKSGPFVIDNQEVKARLKKILAFSGESSPISSLTTHAFHPRPETVSLACDWCFGPLLIDSMEGPRWQQHVNEDLNSYICISGQCSEPIARFASSAQWSQHMINIHGKYWHREVHAPPSWICPVCTKNSTFCSSESLSEHLQGFHEGIFKEHQIATIARKSKILSSRPPNMCPLCCLPINNQQTSISNYTDIRQENQSQGKNNLNELIYDKVKRQNLEPNRFHTSQNSKETKEKTEIRQAELEVESEPHSNNIPDEQDMSSHVASHLQNIMLFTLRLISLYIPIDSSVDTDLRDDSEQSPLMWAAVNGHEGAVRLLVDRGADTKFRHYSQQTPLSRAAEKGHEGVVKLLLDRGADIELRDLFQQTPLSWAAMNGHEGVVELLLDRGANIEFRDYFHQTPLLRAAEKGHEGIVKLLLDKGANIELRDLFQQTPLSWAVVNRHEGVVKLLLDRGADIEFRDSSQLTPLSLAARRGYEGIVKLLLDKGANIESWDSARRTPLSWAARNRRKGVVKLLLERGANLKSADISQIPFSWDG